MTLFRHTVTIVLYPTLILLPLQRVDADLSSPTLLNVGSVLVAGGLDIDGHRTALTQLFFNSPSPEISVPDPNLNAAIRASLQKPNGPLTEDDLLGLTKLDASQRNIADLTGLGSARNLLDLNLRSNRLSGLRLPPELTKLKIVDLSFNPLDTCTFPEALSNLSSVTVQSGHLTNVTLPSALTVLLALDLGENRLSSLTLPPNLVGIGYLSLSNNQVTNIFFPATLREMDSLNLDNNRLTTFILPDTLTNTFYLDAAFNTLTNCTLPPGLSHLTELHLQGNELTTITLPAGLNKLLALDLSQNLLTNVFLPADMTNLTELNLFYNQLADVQLPEPLPWLTELNLDFNQFSNIVFPAEMPRLELLHLRSNRFTQFTLPANLTELTYLDVGENPLLTEITLPAGLGKLQYLRLLKDNLTDLRLPVGLTNLTGLNVSENKLTNIFLPDDLGRLDTLNLGGNQLTAIELPAGLTNVTGFYLTGNNFTNITLPPDLVRLRDLGYLGNPLSIFVLPEPLASNSLAETVNTLRAQGVSIFAYPLDIELSSAKYPPIFRFTIHGPPGTYTVSGSDDFKAWSTLGSVTNIFGSTGFADVSTNPPVQRFYLAAVRSAPSNMVFVPASTFMMGSPTNETDRNVDETQTTVTLSRGFWIGKYEVTEAEYLSLMSTNPSFFPSDLSNPVSSVSWFDATNYCWNLTLRERAAGRIPASSRYRLPTEAEWECAARAGTTTRFTFGDDPNYPHVKDYAWMFSNAALMVHPVGQKLPNQWGLYDMTGNVWEWCQDWYGPLPGDSVTDPIGPDSNPIGFKVTKGGAYDYAESDCRSARRFFFGVHPFLTDSNLGFRVVLADEPEG